MKDRLAPEPEISHSAPGWISDEELTALALAADPDAPLAVDAVPLERYLAKAAAPLPEWYMMPVMARPDGNRFRQTVVLVVVAAFLLIEAFGLCSTFGQLPFVH